MKQCPECKRTYQDNSLNFCLEDGATLIQESTDEPLTAILPGEIPPTEKPTVRQYSSAQPHASSEIGLDRPPSRSANKLWVAILIPVLALTVGFFIYRYWKDTAAKPIDSIAVLPFENLNANSDTDYLSDGISEALINSLTDLQQLKVVARSTAFRYKGKDIDPKMIGRELGVGSVLMGRVRLAGDSLDVQVDLVDTASGTQLWGQEFERKLSDVVTIKQAIAREVTDNLRLRLSGEQQRRLEHKDSTNAEAYQSYLRGRYYASKRTADNLYKAIEQFQKSIDSDPNYALGYVGIADCYLLLEELAGTSPSDTLPKARNAADNALKLDDSLAEAHTSSAAIYEAMWQWNIAEAEFNRAITLNPNYPTAHHWFSIYFRMKGQVDDSLREIKQAQKLDPLSSVIGQNVSEVLILKNEIDSSIAQSKSTIDLDPSFPGVHDELGWAYFKQRRTDDAVAEFQKAVDLSNRASRFLGDLGFGYAVSGKRTEALAIVKELEERYERGESRGQFIATVLAGLGDRDQAFAWLEKDMQPQCGIRPPFFRWWFSFEDLHSDQRYTDLIRRMGL